MAAQFDLVIMTVSSAFGVSPTIPLSAAATVNGVTYLTFANAGATGDISVDYSILDSGNSEIGTATYVSTSVTLTSRTPTRSTAASSFINASSGAIVTCTLRAETVNTFFNVIAKQLFTSSGTYTPTSGMLYAIGEAVGSGAGGGGTIGSVGSVFAGGGGGGGSYARAILLASAVGASQTISVGAAGVGGASSVSGSSGGSVSIGTLLVAPGGSGGTGGFSGQLSAGGAGGVIGTGDFVIPGGSGNSGLVASGFASLFLTGGDGGGSFFGQGGVMLAPPNATVTNGTAGSNYGAGGGGAVTHNSTANGTGGNASKGAVFITEFCRQ